MNNPVMHRPHRLFWLAGIGYTALLVTLSARLSGMGELDDPSVWVFFSPPSLVQAGPLMLLTWVIAGGLLATQRHRAARVWLAAHVVLMPLALAKASAALGPPGVVVRPPSVTAWRATLWSIHAVRYALWWWAAIRMARTTNDMADMTS